MKHALAPAAALAAGLAAAFAAPAAAASLTSEAFLEWTPDRQAIYIRASMLMAEGIAGANSETQRTCLVKWYFANPKAGNAEIRAAMKAHGRMHPTVAIVDVARKRCGAFRY